LKPPLSSHRGHLTRVTTHHYQLTTSERVAALSRPRQDRTVDFRLSPSHLIPSPLHTIKKQPPVKFRCKFNSRICRFRRQERTVLVAGLKRDRGNSRSFGGLAGAHAFHFAFILRGAVNRWDCIKLRTQTGIRFSGNFEAAHSLSAAVIITTNTRLHGCCCCLNALSSYFFIRGGVDGSGRDEAEELISTGLEGYFCKWVSGFCKKIKLGLLHVSRGFHIFIYILFIKFFTEEIISSRIQFINFAFASQIFLSLFLIMCHL
jgi:hypothetical protein